MHRSCMHVTIIRLSVSEKRRVAAGPRHRSLNPSEYLRRSTHAG